ncbi:MAG: hypothetical protein HC906_06155, partial [Bacteroidales bacterium]|nr:hypothetical protein [Bacteroidales bacterium]
MSSGDADIGRTAITVNGSISIPAGRTLTLSNANGAKTFNGDITINGLWINTGNSAVTFGGDLTVNNTAIFTSGTGIQTFSGISKNIDGTIASLSFPAVVVTGSVTNNLECTVSSLSGAGTWTQADNSVLNASGAVTITNLAATATGNTVKYNGTGAQSIGNYIFYNLTTEGGNTKTQTGNVQVSNQFTLGTATTYNPNTFDLAVSRSIQLFQEPLPTEVPQEQPHCKISIYQEVRSTV